MSSSKVREALASFMEEKQPQQVELGQVAAVDAQAQTCDVQVAAGYVHYGVRLTPVQGADTYVLPKVGSWVAILPIDGSAELWCVAMFSELDTIVLRGGGFGGMVKIEELRQSLDSIQQYCEALSSAVSTALSAVGSGSAASGPAGAAAFQNAMAGRSIDIKDMENTEVTHG